jgi:hypothetical protein
MAGTVKEPVLLERATVRALVAVLVIDTVQLPEALGPIAAGHDREESWGGVTPFRVNDCEPPFKEAVITADCCKPRFVTVAVKEAVVCPPVTVTVDGIATPLLLEAKATVAPPAGAGALRVSVQSALPGAATEAGEQLSVAGCKVTLNAITADRVMLFKEAVTVAFCAVLKLEALTVKLALFWFPGIVTLTGTVNEPLLLERATVVALVATLSIDTVQLPDAPEPIAAGHDTEES